MAKAEEAEARSLGRICHGGLGGGSLVNQENVSLTKIGNPETRTAFRCRVKGPTIGSWQVQPQTAQGGSPSFGSRKEDQREVQRNPGLLLCQLLCCAALWGALQHTQKGPMSMNRLKGATAPTGPPQSLQMCPTSHDQPLLGSAGTPASGDVPDSHASGVQDTKAAIHGSLGTERKR